MVEIKTFAYGSPLSQIMFMPLEAAFDEVEVLSLTALRSVKR